MKRRTIALLLAAALGIAATNNVMATDMPSTLQISDNERNNTVEFGTFNTAETGQIHQTITGFLQALRYKQAQNLTLLASLQMREQFTSATAMMVMMTRVHLPIIHSRNLFMHKPQTRDGYIVQSVYFTGPKNLPWKAAYFLVRDEQGNFGISGCHIKRLKGRFV